MSWIDYRWQLHRHSMVNIECIDSSNKELILEWCNNNAKGPYEFTIGGNGGRPTMHFKLEEDAVLFKLRWL